MDEPDGSPSTTTIPASCASVRPRSVAVRSGRAIRRSPSVGRAIAETTRSDIPRIRREPVEALAQDVADVARDGKRRPRRRLGAAERVGDLEGEERVPTRGLMHPRDERRRERSTPDRPGGCADLRDAERARRGGERCPRRRSRHQIQGVHRAGREAPRGEDAHRIPVQPAQREATGPEPRIVEPLDVVHAITTGDEALSVRNASSTPSAIAR